MALGLQWLKYFSSNPYHCSLSPTGHSIDLVSNEGKLGGGVDHYTHSLALWGGQNAPLP